MSNHDDQGGRDDDSCSTAKRIIGEQLAAVEPIFGTLRQVEAVLDGVSRSTRLGLLEDAEAFTRQAGDIFHDFARLIADLRRADGG